MFDFGSCAMLFIFFLSFWEFMVIWTFRDSVLSIRFCLGQIVFKMSSLSIGYFGTNRMLLKTFLSLNLGSLVLLYLQVCILCGISIQSFLISN